MRRGQVEVSEFVYNHDKELEYYPLVDYGLESATTIGKPQHHHTASIVFFGNQKIPSRVVLWAQGLIFVNFKIKT
ncbi:hypothetical protein Taro_019510 [Colocasia esculenta]|uniref:Uncharacterized protein n=1 Tax=Colocasia esculenta TaxID=4460 RepID=A0A843UTN1_COLES|nr:hypothetical protein [Colocasia esculenta]